MTQEIRAAAAAEGPAWSPASTKEHGRQDLHHQDHLLCLLQGLRHLFRLGDYGEMKPKQLLTRVAWGLSLQLSE